MVYILATDARCHCVLTNQFDSILKDKKCLRRNINIGINTQQAMMHCLSHTGVNLCPKHAFVEPEYMNCLSVYQLVINYRPHNGLEEL